jgi:hypothetical protein
MTSAARKYLSDIGRRGGQKSRRTLTTAQATKMWRARELKAAAKRKALKNLERLQFDTDTESAHAKADDVLCGFLRAIGYADVVEEFEKVQKWYA